MFNSPFNSSIFSCLNWHPKVAAVISSCSVAQDTPSDLSLNLNRQPVIKNLRPYINKIVIKTKLSPNSCPSATTNFDNRISLVNSLNTSYNF